MNTQKPCGEMGALCVCAEVGRLCAMIFVRSTSVTFIVGTLNVGRFSVQRMLPIYLCISLIGLATSAFGQAPHNKDAPNPVVQKMDKIGLSADAKAARTALWKDLKGDATLSPEELGKNAWTFMKDLKDKLKTPPEKQWEHLFTDKDKGVFNIPKVMEEFNLKAVDPQSPRQAAVTEALGKALVPAPPNPSDPKSGDLNKMPSDGKDGVPDPSDPDTPFDPTKFQEERTFFDPRFVPPTDIQGNREADADRLKDRKDNTDFKSTSKGATPGDPPMQLPQMGGGGGGGGGGGKGRITGQEIRPGEVNVGAFPNINTPFGVQLDLNKAGPRPYSPIGPNGADAVIQAINDRNVVQQKIIEEAAKRGLAPLRFPGRGQITRTAVAGTRNIARGGMARRPRPQLRGAPRRQPGPPRWAPGSGRRPTPMPGRSRPPFRGPRRIQ